MKHYIISEEQFRQLTHELILANYLETPLLELKRLSDEEIKDVLVSVDAETNRLPPGFRQFAHAIMDKLGVPNA